MAAIQWKSLLKQRKSVSQREKSYGSLQTDTYFISLCILISSHLKTVTTVEIMIFVSLNDIICVCALDVHAFVRSHDEIYLSKSNSSSRFRYPFNDGSNIHYYYYYYYYCYNLFIQQKKYIYMCTISSNPGLIVSGNG